jgi:hypothetical protein
MLQTINGFDLLLVLIIIALGYRAFNLNRECEDYVRQILQVSWELQEEIQVNKYRDQETPFDKGIYADVCNYCLDINGFECTCAPF